MTQETQEAVRTDPEVVKELRQAGFVHITGLPVQASYALDDEEVRAQADVRHLGHWDQNNSKTVLVTETGEVWLASGYDQEVVVLARKICPKGTGAFVPLSNGESIDSSLLLMRVRDPYNDCHGHFPATPKPTAS